MALETILDTAKTWFLESFSQGPYGSLVIRLAEGVVASSVTTPEVAPGVSLAPKFKVSPTQRARVAEVIFENPLGFFTHREGFDSIDPDLVFERTDTYILKLKKSSLREYAKKATGIIGVSWGELAEYHVWTEDQIFQVFCTEPPEVRLLPCEPDASIQRGETWFSGAAI
jgi:hypothetical protein